MTPIHITRFNVSFGDCDPAGIVYYPNMFRWVDATYHDFLRQFGGHKAICADLGAVGTGLMDVQAGFRSPLADGDDLEVKLIALDWARKSLTLRYHGMVGDRLAYEAVETRGMFIPREGGGIRAGEMAPLRALIEAGAR